MEELEEHKKKNNVFVSYIGKKNETFDHYEIAARNESELSFVHYFNEDEPKVTLHRNFDEDVTMSKVDDHSRILNHILEYRYELVMNFDHDAIKRVIEGK